MRIYDTRAKSPTTERFWQAMSGFPMTAAIKGAIEPGILTQIATGNATAVATASAGSSSDRVLCI